MAGHQAALQAIGAWSVLDHPESRGHGCDDGCVVFQTLSSGDPDVFALSCHGDGCMGHDFLVYQ